MDSKNLKQLEEAKAYFYAWRLVEAYHIFRRYFDRLPFKPEKAHAQYIGMFVRTLVELGKEFELNFYLKELERLHARSKLPEISYTLGVVYRYQNPPQWEKAKKLFEDVLQQSNSQDLHAKSRMWLANYYSCHEDLAACRYILENIQTSDTHLQSLLSIWKGYVLYLEKKYDLGIDIVLKVIEQTDPKKDWYTYSSAAPILALLYLDKGEKEKAKELISQFRQLFDGRCFKSIQFQLKELESRLQEEKTLSVLTLTKGERESFLTYQNKKLRVSEKTPAEKLILLLAKKGFIEKSTIVKSIYLRPYDSATDDKLIYYQIHSVRKRLKTIGLPSEAIAHEANGYRLLPEVHLIEEEL